MSGLKLRREIGQLGLTYRDFAKACDISDHTLWKVTRNKKVRPSTLGKIRNRLAELKSKGSLGTAS